MNRITALAATVALAAGSLALTTPTQAAPAKAQAYKVTAKANLEVAVAKEDTVKVKGRVTPKAAGEKVVLQQRVGNKKSWKSTGNAKIKKNGTYVLKDKPSTQGPREYRVLKPASKGLKKGYSKALAVEVYRWEKLVYRPSGPRVNVEPAGVLIGAEYFGQSLATTTSGHAVVGGVHPRPQVHRPAGDVRPHRQLRHRLERRRDRHRRRCRPGLAPAVRRHGHRRRGPRRLGRLPPQGRPVHLRDAGRRRRRRDARGALHALTRTRSAAAGTTGITGRECSPLPHVPPAAFDTLPA